MEFKREECLEFAKHYIDASREAAKEYDGRMFWLAGGAIALSAAFVQKLTETHPHPVLLGLLGVSWALLLLGILIVVISFQLGGRAYDAWIQYWMQKMDSTLGSASDCRKQALSIGKWTGYLNWTALVLIVVGLATLGTFVYLNLAGADSRVTAKTTQSVTKSLESTAAGGSTVTSSTEDVTSTEQVHP